jgi:hypothetical protein
LLRDGYLCGLRPVHSYHVKNNTLGSTEVIGRYSNNIQILKVRGQLFENVLQGTHFQFSKRMFCYVLNDVL